MGSGNTPIRLLLKSPMSQDSVSIVVPLIKRLRLRPPGIEPGSSAWKAAMLTTIPPTKKMGFFIITQKSFIITPGFYNNTSHYKLEIVFTIAAPAFDMLFIGCVLNTKIAYTTAEK